MIRVVLDGLIKRFDRVAVVDGLTLEVPPGELTYVLGPSGAGKTTLARLVAGLETPDEGEIYFDGRLMNAVPPGRRRVGLVFQDPALWPHLTVAENIGYGLRFRGLARPDRRKQTAAAMEAARVEGLAGLRPDELTEAQHQRVALARALAVGPEILVLDDPLARLDSRAGVEFREEIRRVHEETETTTVVLTSDPREALAQADRLAVVDLGRVVQVGPPHELYNRPADAFVAQLLGPTNLIQGHVDGPERNGEVTVRTPLGRLVGTAPGGSAPAGTPVTIAIRPEAFGLGAGSSLFATANRFAATVERQVFLGEVRQVHLRGPGDWPVTALALQSQSRGLREGQHLTVSVPPDQVIVLPGKHVAHT